MMVKNRTSVLKSALPVHLESDGKKAVLILHGYGGYPLDMYALAVRLHQEGYTAAVPRLPGHGTNTSDFLKSGWRLWLNHVRNQYLDLQSRFEEVAVVGLSMGGVLGLLLAEEFEPSGLVLLAPALAVRKPLFYFTPVLRFIIPRIRRNFEPGTETEADRIILEREYWSYHYSSTLANLNRLIRMARRGLPGVECPVCVMVSAKDRTVPVRVKDIISAGVSGKVTEITLEKSPHVFFNGPEKDFVVEQVAAWFKNVR